jgi:hypothetical protein
LSNDKAENTFGAGCCGGGWDTFSFFFSSVSISRKLTEDLLMVPQGEAEEGGGDKVGVGVDVGVERRFEEAGVRGFSTLREGSSAFPARFLRLR